MPFHGSTPSSTGVEQPATCELACRHVFHEACLSTRDSTMACLICGDVGVRVPVDLTAVRGPRPLSSMPETEYHFRLQRIRDLYPEFVSSSMLERWCNEDRSIELVVDLVSFEACPSDAAIFNRKGIGVLSKPIIAWQVV